MNRGRSYFIGVGLAAAGFGVIAPAIAQEGGGLNATLSVRQSIDASSNFDLSDPAQDGTRAVTALNFGLVSQTQTSVLSLNAGGRIEFGNSDGSSNNGFVDPSVVLSYKATARASRVSLSARYAESDINALTAVTVDPGVGVFGLNQQLFVGSGKRQRTSLNATYEIGLDAPLGLTFQTGYNVLDYTNTVDPDLFQTETLSYGVTARMRISPSLTMNVGVNQSQYEAQDSAATRRENSSVFVSATYDIRADLSASTRLSYDHNATEADTFTGFGLSGRTRVIDEGFGGGFGITKRLPNGSIGADFDTNVTSDGRRDTLRVTRTMDLPSGGLSLSVGAVRTDNSSVERLLNVDYSKAFKRGQIGLGLSQEVSLNTDDQTTINTNLRANYDEKINSRSSWGLSAALADSNAVDVDNDTRRIDLGVNYRHEVSQDWDLVANYTYSTSESSGSTDRKSGTLSLGLSKTFNFLP